MFHSLPQYEFHIPEGLAAPGSKHWRAVVMTLHMPWFLLTLDRVDDEDQEVRMTYTLCVAWDSDLADALKSIDAKRVRGLVAMMPAWASPTGQWSSRQITEVWLDSGDDGTFVTLTDAAGERFDAGIRGEPPRAGPAGQLLLRLPSGKQRTLQPRKAGSGRARRQVRASR
jgi:hypothetical protein